MSVAIVRAQTAHINRVARGLRAVDRAECAAMGYAPKAALRTALAGSSLAMTALVDGVPQAMFGVTPICALDRSARIWFLGSDAVMRHGRALLALGPDLIDMLHDGFATLENYVSTANAPAIRLLRRWGFQIDSEVHMFATIPFVAFRSVR